MEGTKRPTSPVQIVLRDTLIAAQKEDAIAILQDAKADEIPVQVVGLAGGTSITVNGAHPPELDRLRAAWESWMPGLMDQPVEAAE